MFGKTLYKDGVGEVGTKAALKDKPHVAWAMRFPPFVVVSYAWLSREHPDPDGRQLREVLAPTIEWYMAERARLIKESLFEDDIGAAARLDAPFTAEGVDFAIFVDYCGLWQHERTPVQAASFGRGLGGMVRACTLLHCNRALFSLWHVHCACYRT